LSFLIFTVASFSRRLVMQLNSFHIFALLLSIDSVYASAPYSIPDLGDHTAPLQVILGTD